MSATRALSAAFRQGWRLCGTKTNGDGEHLYGLLLEYTGEVAWFSEDHLISTFK